jgi:hypothetical protein
LICGGKFKYSSRIFRDSIHPNWFSGILAGRNLPSITMYRSFSGKMMGVYGHTKKDRNSDIILQNAKLKPFHPFGV